MVFERLSLLISERLLNNQHGFRVGMSADKAILAAGIMSQKAKQDSNERCVRQTSLEGPIFFDIVFQLLLEEVYATCEDLKAVLGFRRFVQSNARFTSKLSDIAGIASVTDSLCEDDIQRSGLPRLPDLKLFRLMYLCLFEFKVWIQTGKKSDWLRNEYITAVNGMRENLIRKSVPNGLTFVGELHGSRFSTKMDHLVCFLPATLAYGYLHGMPADHLELAISLAETCFHMYNDTKTGLSPEIVHFNLANSDKSDFYIMRLDSFNLLRPEAIEAFFYLYQITKNPKYQEWGKQIFRAFNTYSRVEPAGYAPLLNVQSEVSGYRDKMESFWIAETLKYFLLLFDDSLATKYDLRKWVFNSEAHPFPLHSSDTISVIQDLYNF
ncbi:hypothetical protein ACTXT7_000296 [Hymenolepis weldensis]